MALCSLHWQRSLLICQVLVVLGKTDTDLLLSALQQVFGDVEELLMTVKSGISLPSHVNVLARCKC